MNVLSGINILLVLSIIIYPEDFQVLWRNEGMIFNFYFCSVSKENPNFKNIIDFHQETISALLKYEVGTGTK